MRKCPFCAEEIQNNAVVCKHCGGDVKPAKKKGSGCSSLGCLGILLLVLFGAWANLFQDSGATPSAPPTPARGTPVPRPTATPPPTPPPMFHVNPGGDAFHSDGCKFVTAEAQAMPHEQAAEGRRPCRTCRPPTPLELKKRAEAARAQQIEARRRDTGRTAPIARSPQDALSQMEIAFVGSHRRAAISDRLTKAMTLYSLPRTEENYSRAGSALVALRKRYGISEMEILDYMIRSHVEGVNMSFPDAAGLSAAFMTAERNR